MPEIFKTLFADVSFRRDELFYIATSDPKNLFISGISFNKLICFMVKIRFQSFFSVLLSIWKDYYASNQIKRHAEHRIVAKRFMQKKSVLKVSETVFAGP